jgi:hypothetical protein
MFGRPESSQFEALGQDWIAATNGGAQAAICAGIQRRAFIDVPLSRSGKFRGLTAHRAGLRGSAPGAASFFGV